MLKFVPALGTNIHEIKYDGCTYLCYLKETQGKKGPYFRAYCGRKDAKCKVAVHLPAVVTKKVLPKYVPPKPKHMPTMTADKMKADKLRTLADKMEKQINAKLNPPIGEQRTTARRARIASNMREQGEHLQKIQEVLYYMAGAIQANRLPPIL